MVWIPPLKTTIKSNGILIIRSKFHTTCSGERFVATDIFFKKKLPSYTEKPKIRRRSPVWAGLGAKICALAAARVKISKHWFFVLCVDFIGIDKFAGRFTSQVDDRKSSKIQFVSSMLQKTPKRRSPNPYNYKLKWTETVIVPEIRSKCNKFRKSNLTVSSKCYSSEYAIFPQRQP